MSHKIINRTHTKLINKYKNVYVEKLLSHGSIIAIKKMTIQNLKHLYKHMIIVLSICLVEKIHHGFKSSLENSQYIYPYVFILCKAD